jgi:uncharacterized membrane protein YgdD (TMEM256/DUF423 family)
MAPGKGIAVLGGLLGLSGVILAALGSHAIPGMDVPENARNWWSANLIQLLHAPVLLALAALARDDSAPLLRHAASLLFLGIVLFSGSIYIMVAYSLDSTFHLAPAGGFVLMAGWLLAVIGFFRA